MVFIYLYISYLGILSVRFQKKFRIRAREKHQKASSSQRNKEGWVMISHIFEGWERCLIITLHRLVKLPSVLARPDLLVKVLHHCKSLPRYWNVLIFDCNFGSLQSHSRGGWAHGSYEQLRNAMFDKLCIGVKLPRYWNVLIFDCNFGSLQSHDVLCYFCINVKVINEGRGVVSELCNCGEYSFETLFFKEKCRRLRKTRSGRGAKSPPFSLV